MGQFPRPTSPAGVWHAKNRVADFDKLISAKTNFGHSLRAKPISVMLSSAKTNLTVNECAAALAMDSSRVCRSENSPAGDRAGWLRSY